MKSIRAQLLAWLLPGFAVVCVAAGAGIYLSERQAIEADLDARLGKLAGLARLALRPQGASGAIATRGPTVRVFSTREEFKTPGQYFQQWTVGGAVERKSPNLGSIDLPRPAEFPRDEVRYNATLDNGDRVRVSAVRIPQIGPAPPAAFAVALSRREGDERLSRLIGKLVIGGLACCAVLGGLLALALRSSMRPLVRLGEQATTMGANSLHERFAVEAMPREIAPIVTRLNDLMARLEESFERQRRFSGYLAHELRTPLAAIRSTSEVALKWPEQATPEDHASIARLAARLQQTVDSLANYWANPGSAFPARYTMEMHVKKIIRRLWWRNWRTDGRGRLPIRRCSARVPPQPASRPSRDWKRRVDAAGRKRVSAWPPRPWPAAPSGQSRSGRIG